MPKQLTKVTVHPHTMRAIPEASYMLCENGDCGKEFRIADAWSYPACMALSGPDIHVSIACEEEQHFGCSHECALALHNQCITEHILPRHQAALEVYRQAQAAAAAEAAAQVQAEAPAPSADQSAPATVSGENLPA